MNLDRRLRVINNCLSLAILLLALYIILLPFLPQITFWAKRVGARQQPAIMEQGVSVPVDVKNVPNEDTLVIPGLSLQTQVFSGSSATELKKGAWHRPHTSTPDQGGNTVIVGHRFTYTQPQGVFYHLDKVAVGDKIILYWDKQEYVYTVQAISIVRPSAIEIEAPTEESVLTIYTCTPLWSAKDRLVIRAGLDD